MITLKAVVFTLVTDALTGDHPRELSTIGSSKFAGLKSAFVWENAQEYVNLKALKREVCK